MLGGVPWCFYPGGGGPGGDCAQLNWAAPEEGPGFPPDFQQLLWNNFKANLNVEGSGAVVAAPDRNQCSQHRDVSREEGPELTTEI